MPTEFISASVPVMRDALRRRLEFAKQRLGTNVPKLDVIAWVSFLWGATNGLLIGINDLQELRKHLPPLGYDPTAEFTKYPTSPANQALIDSAAEEDPIWSTAAQYFNCGIGDGLHYFGGRMPEESVVAWLGHLRGAFEAGSIDQVEYADLVHMLPVVENNPVDLIVESAEAQNTRHN